MSDLGRKDLSSQVGEKVKPDSSKTTTEKVGENLSGAGDKVAAAVQPNSEKSTTQKAGDSVRGNTDSAQKEGGGIIDNISKTVSDTVDSVTGKTDDAAKKNDLK
ncbi:related to HSP12 Heat shock protein [Rhynchosporium agropyri]|uniref:Related to HSP12 Heat shock protein n=3 Tax=Rhynchosporium TaxID=38037 RepID=A0A1E1MG79_RHYSE|nr:related to HSP12 Heat shock protein [Rhynchosporium commune]CZT05677.1 related to HSP12 Heat shock protein [Rhynchosporium agropyri]CZT47715.1 related to HSP12 Heat shock protein [Rhynchosporium secalis]